MRQRVLLTRPGERGEVLATALAEAGYDPVPLSVLRLETLALDAETRGRILELDGYDGVIVVSPQAAVCLAEAIDSYWPQLPLGLRFYAVGRATAEALHAALGVPAVMPPAGTGEDSEALLEAPSLKGGSGKRLLLARGEGGRERLVEVLGERGAQVDPLALYRRCHEPPQPPGSTWLEHGDYRALVVTSAEILHHLVKWCGTAALNQPLIVSSCRLATLATTLGFGSLHVASGASPSALAEALDALPAPRCATFDQGDQEKA
ncbi:uroporphyrinogen-III synthase [Salinicola aestuarinus]|uniref:uroporphyrinogen-III synthase n=1 Tax=Salinicola aestuarinus TaxID=1949082 RepID=UPI000DA1D45E|nr:uroporphyrinogen-III synthase [Salinicola aestuarinus]